jgi:succinate dehydrogenase / fumarate reductase membrane anchor subunit
MNQTTIIEGPARSVVEGAPTGSRFEVYAWFLTRVSGVLLLLMGAFNLVYANLAGGRGNLDAGAQMRWAFFPISFHVSNTSVEVAPNFSNPFWQVYCFLLILFASTHGLNGIRVVLEDYVTRPLLQAWLRVLLGVVWLFTLMGAIFLIFVYYS